MARSHQSDGTRSCRKALDTLKFGREFGERLSKFCKEYAESLKATPTAPRR